MTAPDVRWDQLLRVVVPRRKAIVAHPLYEALTSMGAVRTFTEHHVWAVWDFMSLLTALQRDLTCVTIPWIPRESDVSAQRFINEIKLGEESDTHPDGGWTSHLGLYLEAMEEIGADTGPISKVLRDLAVLPDSPVGAAEMAGAPPGALHFIRTTFDFIHRGTTLEVAAAFALGREQLIPDMFRPLVRDGTGRLFLEYIQRHIELDEGTHGPLAHQLVARLCGDDAKSWKRAEQAAVTALDARHHLWDETLRAVARV